MATTIGFPRELQNEIDYSLPASMTSYAVKVVPSNLSQSQSATQTLTASTVHNLNGTSQNIIFEIPAGQSKDTFVDHRFSTVSFRVNYEIVNTPAAAIVTSACLRGSAMSHFSRTFTQSQSGVILDDVNSLDVIHDMLVQTEIDVAQRDVLAKMYGFQYETFGSNSLNANQGHKITPMIGTLAAASQTRYSYCMPLPNSLIGKGASKFFQIGATNKLQVVLQTNNIIPVTIVTSSASTAANFRITIDNISLNLQYIQLGGDAMKLLNKTGLQYYSGITYRASTSTIPSGTSNAISLLSGIRGSSVRALFCKFSEATTLSTAGCINSILDGKMPLASAISWNINGMLMPSNPTDLVRNPALAFSQTQQALGNFNNYEFKSGLVPSRYFVTLPTSGSIPNDSDYVLTESGTESSADSIASFLWGYSLEKIQKAGILDGQNLNSGSTFLNMTWGNTNSNAVTAFFIGKLDVIYVLDTVSGEVSVRM